MEGDSQVAATFLIESDLLGGGHFRDAILSLCGRM
jgi:hypothetical protein